MGNIKISENQQIYYELIDGDHSLPYLVFLHEGLGSVAMFKEFPELLCARTRCPGLMYDRTGYGKSSALTHKRSIHYMHEYALNELPQVIDATIPSRPFILIGHSDGGSISLIFGAQRSQYIKAIITIAAHVFVEQETVDCIAKADEAFAQGKLAGLFKYHGENTDRVFKEWSSTWLSYWFRSWNIEYLLPSIYVPVLVIQGSEDQYGTAAQVESITSKTSGKAQTLLLDGCGHSPHYDSPELLIEVISEFIKNNL